MNAVILRWCTVVVILLLVIGCDGDDDENQNALTVANLQGTYDLSTDAISGDLVGDDGLNAISGTLELTENTMTVTTTFSGMGPFTLTGNTLTITDNDGNTADSQVTLSDTGNTLTVINEDGETLVFTRRDGTGTSDEVTVANLQGAYDIDVSRSTIEDLVSGELEIVGNMAMFTGTNSQTGSYALAGRTLTFTHTDGGIDVFQARLTNDGNTLTLVDEDNDTFVYERR